MRQPGVLLGTACAALAVAVAVVVILVFSADSNAEPTQAEYLANVADICRLYGPELDKIRPPDVAEPANVIAAVTAALPVVKAQEREVKALEAPPELRSRIARWIELQDQRIAMLEKALRAGRRQDFRTLGVVYIDFVLAGPKTARAGIAIGIPHPPC